MSTHHRLTLLTFFILASQGFSVARGADLPATPTSPKEWINSEPIDLNKLKGKVVALIFYEES